jgi:hypothetical protein
MIDIHCFAGFFGISLGSLGLDTFFLRMIVSVLGCLGMPLAQYGCSIV